MFNVSITHTNLTGKPTIYSALKEKLVREPSNAELKADVQRIFDECLVDAAGKGQLPHQRKQ